MFSAPWSARCSFQTTGSQEVGVSGNPLQVCGWCSELYTRRWFGSVPGAFIFQSNPLSYLRPPPPPFFFFSSSFFLFLFSFFFPLFVREACSTTGCLPRGAGRGRYPRMCVGRGEGGGKGKEKETVPNATL